MIRYLWIAAAMAMVIASPARGVTVFAAASLSDALTCIGTNFQAQSGIRVEFNFAASSTLARQIEQGAPADIFFSADEEQMDRLAGKKLINAVTRKSLLGNSLVIVIPSDSTLQIQSPKDLTRPEIRLIAFADPQAVPAGVYAKAWLEKIGLWKVIGPKVVSTENVRAALAAVASGNTDAGVVYKTDAAISRHVKIAFEVPRSDSSDISYPVALVRDSKNSAAAGQFLDYLSSEQAGQVFKRYGFLLRK